MVNYKVMDLQKWDKCKRGYFCIQNLVCGNMSRRKGRSIIQRLEVIPTNIGRSYLLSMNDVLKLDVSNESNLH